jgi:crossover junction endodeoxyribonuclease RusA
MTREEVMQLLANQRAAAERRAQAIEAQHEATPTPPLVSLLARTAAEAGYDVTLPYPPSVNSIWRNLVIGGRARTVMSKEGKEYRKTAHAALDDAGIAKPLQEPVRVELRVYRPRRIGDLDNTAKAILDALKGRAFVDDSQVVELHMFRHDDKHRPRVEVMIAEVTP